MRTVCHVAVLCKTKVEWIEVLFGVKTSKGFHFPIPPFPRGEGEWGNVPTVKYSIGFDAAFAKLLWPKVTNRLH